MIKKKTAYYTSEYSKQFTEDKSLTLYIKDVVIESYWQRREDLNLRAGYPTYRISSADPSATWVLLRDLRRSLKKRFMIWLHSSAKIPLIISGSWFKPG